jgi:hypothetical protein
MNLAGCRCLVWSTQDNRDARVADLTQQLRRICHRNARIVNKITQSADNSIDGDTSGTAVAIMAGSAPLSRALFGPGRVVRPRALSEVAMSGRRQHERFQPGQPWDGTLRVMRDVIVQEAAGELVTIGQSPAAIGEVLTLDLAGGGHVVTCRVRVRESRPVIVNGHVRHRVRLELLERSRQVESNDVEQSARA